jgi:hypothetical protein
LIAQNQSSRFNWVIIISLENLVGSCNNKHVGETRYIKNNLNLDNSHHHPENTSRPPSDSMRFLFRHRFLFSLVIVTFITLIAVLSYFFSSFSYDRNKISVKKTQRTATPSVPTLSPESGSPGKTSTWNTYTNDEFQFSIQYPSELTPNEANWVQVGKDAKGYWHLDISDKSDKLGLTTNEFIQISIWPNPKNAGGKPILSIEDSYIGTETPIYFNFQGYPALRYEIEAVGPPRSKSIGIHILRYSTLWEVGGTVFEGKLQNFGRVKQILSSFSFIKRP